MENKIFTRLDIRSSLNFLLLAMVATAFTIFILIKAEEAVNEIQTLSENRILLFKKAGVADDLRAPNISNPVPSEVEGWKTYRNEKYGFEVRYPSDWHHKELGQLSKSVLFSVAVDEVRNQLSEFSPIAVSVVTRLFAEGTFNNPPHNNEPITVDGIRGVRKISPYDRGKEILINLPLDENNIMFGADSKYEEVFNQILSTFKFIK